MKFASVVLLAILAIGVFSTEMQTSTRLGGAGAGQGLEANTQLNGGHSLEANTQLHPRFRRWGYYGGMGGYGGMGYGRMGYGMGGYGMRGYGGYGMGYPMWG
ncbi:hypothetical protein CAEBREN_00457 [Caenorhabditis brenneri]|uniref:Uncharacterized protein n=1 Tax=Caenorhabditis brenneri TaxID=135651 RepID=G0MJE2_CAEBE|nr:hypothetical protein CAEBREN_00457 [Caenorhabditis brenneri]